MPSKIPTNLNFEVEINDQFTRVLELVGGENKNIFITGKAGTGKSTLLHLIRQNSEKNLVVLAPTGLASLNVSGQTIHSFFRFPPSITISEAQKIGRERQSSKVLQNLQLLIIDEISMVRADLLDCIDVFLKTVKKSNLPFGGLQTILIGDLYQLPPVLRYQEQMDFAKMYASPYFFASKVVEELFNGDIFNSKSLLELIELKKVYRQNDLEFINLLDAVRRGEKTTQILARLNQRVTSISDTEKAIILTTTNAASDSINQTNLAKIDLPSQLYLATTSGKFDKQSLPTTGDLELKVGARVMFVKNDLKGKWVNGTLGIVSKLFENRVLVVTDEGKTVEVYPETWELYKTTFNQTENRLENQIIGSFTQLPLKLAWAITIHKSQGQTFDRVILDLQNPAFSAGQTYVALSRCRSFEGLFLTRSVRSSDILTDREVVRFFEKVQNKL
jgi:ATP-dependent exoDNAse (exonuclease V) alpha subunit